MLQPSKSAAAKHTGSSTSPEHVPAPRWQLSTGAKRLGKWAFFGALAAASLAGLFKVQSPVSLLLLTA